MTKKKQSLVDALATHQNKVVSIKGEIEAIQRQINELLSVLGIT